MGIEPTPSAWKADVLPLNSTRLVVPKRLYQIIGTVLQFTSATCATPQNYHFKVVEGEGFEPSKAEPTDLQSAPFDRSGTPPRGAAD